MGHYVTIKGKPVYIKSNEKIKNNKVIKYRGAEPRNFIVGKQTKVGVTDAREYLNRAKARRKK